MDIIMGIINFLKDFFGGLVINNSKNAGGDMSSKKSTIAPKIKKSEIRTVNAAENIRTDNTRNNSPDNVTGNVHYGDVNNYPYPTDTPKHVPEPMLYPYIFISKKQNTSDGTFKIRVNNQDDKPWFLESLEIDGSVCTIGKPLPPQQETGNILVEDMPSPDASVWYNKKYDKCFLIVSGDDNSTRRIEIKINMKSSEDRKRFKFQESSFVARPIRTEIINQPSEG